MCGGATWVTTVGFMESSSCCWNAAAHGVLVYRLVERRQAVPRRDRSGYSLLAALRNCWRRKIFISATGSVLAVWAAIFSAANCSGVASGLSAVIDASSVTSAATGVPAAADERRESMFPSSRRTQPEHRPQQRWLWRRGRPGGRLRPEAEGGQDRTDEAAEARGHRRGGGRLGDRGEAHETSTSLQPAG